MAEKIKLDEPGSEHTMTVGAVTSEEIANNDYYKLTDGSVEINIPAKSVDRQLERVGASNVLGLVGQTIRISRSKELNKFGKSFWNLDPASPNSSATNGKQAVSHSNVPQSSLPPLLRDEERIQTEELHAKLGGLVGKRAKYKEITEFVLREIAPLYVKADIGLSPEAAAACAATLFIQETRAA